MTPFDFEVIKGFTSAISEGIAAPIEHIQDKQIAKLEIKLKMKEVEAFKAYCELEQERTRGCSLTESGHQKMEQCLMYYMFRQQEYLLSESGSKMDKNNEKCGSFWKELDSNGENEK